MKLGHRHLPDMNWGKAVVEGPAVLMCYIVLTGNDDLIRICPIIGVAQPQCRVSDVEIPMRRDHSVPPARRLTCSYPR